MIGVSSSKISPEISKSWDLKFQLNIKFVRTEGVISKAAYFGFALLILGVALGIFGATSPVSSASQQSLKLVDTPLGVDPNDYATQNLQMVKGQTINVVLSIDNQSVMFTFDIMNQTQYYIWYGCAPLCYQPLLGGDGTYYQHANETTPFLVNETVTPSSPYSASFTAPSNGTYYFVFDNSIGTSWSTYVNHNASGYTEGSFALSETQWINHYSANWPLVGLGSVAMLVGGILPALFWQERAGKRIEGTRLSLGI
jgi:hypothetical protein